LNEVSTQLHKVKIHLSPPEQKGFLKMLMKPTRTRPEKGKFFEKKLDFLIFNVK